MHDQTTTIENFLEAAAAKQPTPGGGAVAALAGSLAAAMGEMVLNYSVGKKGLEKHQQELKAALAEFHRARMMMLELMTEDQSAYEALTAARKMPADSPKRAEAVTSGVMLCVRVPQNIAGTAAAVLELTEKLVDQVNHHLLSDLAVCAEMAMATTRAALYNVRVNLAEIGDAEQRGQIEATDRQLLQRAVGLIQKVQPRIWERVSRQG
ncbi:MAG TPA: cyclodeaminase/cyclohydrolase family protein [Tepidisphaeraceae bacterium]|jgi:glutamate formiminotransferase/formiminotetrahydrofolate cyclodeaminase|nr:cyclodeaminase/cyclohydrolase family protein [Tepidisphaeraceae bacterium]